MRRGHLFLIVMSTAALVALGCGGEQTEPETGALEETEMPSKEGVQGEATEGEVVTEARKPVAKPKPTLMVTLPESTQVRVLLLDSIDTDIHTSGQNFRGELSAAIIADGNVVFDSGAAVTGVLDSVVESGRLKTPAELMFSISTIEGPNGPVAVRTYSIHEKKGGKTARDVALIGGGAIVGGIVGKITGKSGGTEIGAAAGAAAGAGAAAATGKDDIVHSAGTEAIFLLREPLNVNVPQ